MKCLKLLEWFFRNLQEEKESLHFRDVSVNFWNIIMPLLYDVSEDNIKISEIASKNTVTLNFINVSSVLEYCLSIFLGAT